MSEPEFIEFLIVKNQIKINNKESVNMQVRFHICSHIYYRFGYVLNTNLHLGYSLSALHIIFSHLNSCHHLNGSTNFVVYVERNCKNRLNKITIFYLKATLPGVDNKLQIRLSFYKQDQHFKDKFTLVLTLKTRSIK
jgi:hypothetical protein